MIFSPCTARKLSHFTATDTLSVSRLRPRELFRLLNAKYRIPQRALTLATPAADKFGILLTMHLVTAKSLPRHRSIGSAVQLADHAAIRNRAIYLTVRYRARASSRLS